MRSATSMWSLPSLWLLPGLWLAPATLVNAQEEVPDQDSFHVRFWSRIAVLGDYLYIEGGEIEQYVEDADDPVAAPVNVTLTLPLNKPWSNDTVEFQEIDKGDKPTVKNFNLWVDNAENRIYQWDGDGPFGDLRGAEDARLWVLTPDGDGGGAWDTVSPANPNVYNGLTRLAGAAGTTCGDMAYLIGGWKGEATDEEASDVRQATPVDSMISLNMTSLEWRDQSLISMSPPLGTYVDGQATCVTGFGTNAFVLTVGGQGGSYSGSPAIDDLPFVDMKNVTFYDQMADVWRWQLTSGSDGAPDERRTHCTVGVQSSEGTFEIYLYGGATNTNSQLDDLWVLTLPGFRWFRIDAPSSARRVHACALVGKSQILVVGGDHDGSEPDPWEQGLGVFDLSTMAWADRYDPDAADYEPPKEIRDWYKDGGMNNVEWSDDGLKKIFASGAAPFSPDASTSEAPGDEDRGQDNTGAIAGGTVGGVAALLIIGAIIFWYRRRRKGKSPPHQTHEAPSHSDISPHQQMSQASHDFSQQQQYPQHGALPFSNKSELDSRTPPAELSSSNHPFELEGDYANQERRS